MAEGSGGGGPEPGSGSKPASTMESAGGRIRFRVELKPDETTIVSWKKLMREANLSDSNRPRKLDSGPSHGGPEQPITNPQGVAPLIAAGPSSSKQHFENEREAQGQAGTNRLSSVIERIERMYAGNGSSDEEDVVLDNIPDDDEYDTDDSFIDDAELDEYFKVDHSTIKHDGFFVNRGKLEHIEPTISADHQPKKRQRKDSEMGRGGSGKGYCINKIVKPGNKGNKAPSSLQRNLLSGQSHMVATINKHVENMQGQTYANAPEILSTDKTTDNRATLAPSGMLSSDGICEGAYVDKQKTGVSSSLKGKESINHDNLAQRSTDRSLHISKSYYGKPPDNVDHPDQSIQPNEKAGLAEKFDLNVPASRDSSPAMKGVVMQRREGSSIRTKSTMLEKAIKELENIVAQFRPPSTEVPDTDNSAQAVKRRLPPEVKQQLAKVAPFVPQTNDGKIPKDVINRLMSIVGHMMQVRTLKRNLKALANMGLSAKQEKDNKIQKIKQEVADMVKLRIPHIRSKVQQQAGNSDDFQEGGPQEKKIVKYKYKMDYALEKKICDLYDLYCERQEEYSGSPVRRLYEELVSLWPSGVIDPNGIKRAIYRVKNRIASSLHKDQDKINRKKAFPPKAERAIAVAQASQQRNEPLPDSCDNTTSISKSVPSAARVPFTFANSAKKEKVKQERKIKESSSTHPKDAAPSNTLPKKKLKKKLSAEVGEAQHRLEKLAVSQKPKHHKQITVSHSKQNRPPAAPPA